MTGPQGIKMEVSSSFVWENSVFPFESRICAMFSQVALVALGHKVAQRHGTGRIVLWHGLAMVA